jgi:hypothetical protein
MCNSVGTRQTPVNQPLQIDGEPPHVVHVSLDYYWLRNRIVTSFLNNDNEKTTNVLIGSDKR